MPDLEISNLPNASAPSGTEEFAVVQSGVTRRINLNELLALAANATQAELDALEASLEAQIAAIEAGTLGGLASAQGVTVSLPIGVDGAYAWNQQVHSGPQIFSNDDWQAGAFADFTARLPTAWRRPVGSYEPSDVEYCDLSAISGTPFDTMEEDSHNAFAVLVDSADNVIVVGNLHSDPMRWAWWNASQASADFTDPTQWTAGGTMVDAVETNVTYPNFIYEPVSNRYLFHYRQGAAGAGDNYINRWNPVTETWSRVCQWFERGSPTRSMYPTHLPVRDDGMIAAFMFFRDTGVGTTSHDIGYAQSPDGGTTWERIDGTDYTLPLHWDSGDNHEIEIIEPIAQGTTLGVGGATWDGDGNPWGFFIQNQLPFLIYWDGAAWNRVDLPARYGTIVGLGRCSMFTHQDRVYIAGEAMPGRGRGNDLVFIDCTEPTELVEFSVVKGIGPNATYPDPEALRRRGLWEQRIGPTANFTDLDPNPYPEAWAHVPHPLVTVPLEQLPILRSGLAAAATEIVSTEGSKQNESWEVTGAGVELVDGAPKWRAPADSTMFNSLLVAQLKVLADVPSGSVLNLELWVQYDEEVEPVDTTNLVSVGAILLDDSESSTTTPWVYVPPLDLGIFGIIYPNSLHIFAEISTGSGTATIKYLGLDVGILPGASYL